MKQRMSELENQIALQNENLNKISNNVNKKEEQLNNDITDYINQISELKNEMEVLNNIITNLTEEKENNAKKISSLLHENEKLKQNIKTNNSNANDNLNENEKINSQKYEEIIMKLKKNMMNLKEENKLLEEVIIKQEAEVNQLSSKIIEVEKVLGQKDKELQESIEYSAKLTSSINFHKNEIIKIKQKQNISEANKNAEIISNLQKELQTMKENLEMKENKLNVLSGNNKSLQEKLNKLTQLIKTELNVNNNGSNTNSLHNKLNANTKYVNKNKSNIHSSYNNYYTNKISISKPQSQLKNKTTRVSAPLNSVSSSNLPKSIIPINNNIENYKENIKNLNRRQNIEDKKLYIVSKHKIKSKTPGKLISSKHQLPESNQIIKKNNIKINNEYKTGIKVSKSNINEKYKQIESKYKNEKKEITKEDTLFNEDDINNLNINKEIISPFTKMEEDIDSIPIIDNMSSHILKPKKEGRNPGVHLYTKNYNEQQSSALSQDKEFPIIESYCMLMEKDKEKNEGNVISNLNRDKNKYEMNCLTNNSNINVGNNLGGYLDLERDGDNNESKLEAKQVEDLKDCVNKILSNIFIILFLFGLNII
jgi:DNA repair exonuclease SbcCD ATPase subunit